MLHTIHGVVLPCCTFMLHQKNFYELPWVYWNLLQLSKPTQFRVLLTKLDNDSYCFVPAFLEKLIRMFETDSLILTNDFCRIILSFHTLFNRNNEQDGEDKIKSAPILFESCNKKCWVLFHHVQKQLNVWYYFVDTLM